jgi:hypothetical protein
MGEPAEYHHDLQSSFWLTYLITCNCTGKFLQGITIMEKSMQWKESIRSISTSMGYSWNTSKGPMLDDRYWHCTLFNTCGVNILWFGTAHKLFHGVVCTVIGE